MMFSQVADDEAVEGEGDHTEPAQSAESAAAELIDTSTAPLADLLVSAPEGFQMAVRSHLPTAQILCDYRRDHE